MTEIPRLNRPPLHPPVAGARPRVDRRGAGQPAPPALGPLVPPDVLPLAHAPAGQHDPSAVVYIGKEPNKTCYSADSTPNLPGSTTRSPKHDPGSTTRLPLSDRTLNTVCRMMS
jgi:hypothetical protein